MTNQNIRGTVALVSMMLATGCAGTRVPVAQLAAAEGAIRAAQETGAEGSPQAALHLHYARQERAEAQRWIDKDEPREAALILRRAEADANLAIALARQARSLRTAEADGQTP